LLAALPYLFTIVVVVFAQSRGGAAMPANLTAIFRTR
jgi:ABC-type uncharacterized transport system permease subunit